MLVIVFLFTFKKNVIFTNFSLKGDSIIVVNYGDKYEDEGFTAKLYNKDISDQVKVKSDVDYGKVGNYEIIYTLKVKYLNIIKMLKSE